MTTSDAARAASAGPETTSPTGAAPRGNLAGVLLVACGAAFIVVLDASIINVALAELQAELRLSDTSLQWVVNAYIVAFGGFLLLGGRAADLFGRKRVFLAGLTLFTVAALVGGFATSGIWLVLARGAQGLGAAILSPATLTVITTVFVDPKERARAVGAWTAAAATGAALGSLVGGVITNFLGWRWVLFINVPIGLILMLGAVLWLTESAARYRRRNQLDLTGTVVVTAGLVSLCYGIVSTTAHGWASAQVLVPLVAGVVLLGAFLFVESRATDPIVPLGIFNRRTVSAGNAVSLVGGAASLPVFYLLSLFLQRVMGYSPLDTGLAFLPMSFCIVAGAGASSGLLPKIGPRVLIVGGGIIASVGLAWLSMAPADATFVGDVLVPTILIGIGMGLVTVPITAVATSGVEAEHAGLASGLVSTTQQFGGAIGLAALATIAATRTTSELDSGTGDPAAMTEALASGYSQAMLVAAGLIVVASLIALLVPRQIPATDMMAMH